MKFLTVVIDAVQTEMDVSTDRNEEVLEMVMARIRTRHHVALSQLITYFSLTVVGSEFITSKRGLD
jgi:hypothetical protein